MSTKPMVVTERRRRSSVPAIIIGGAIAGVIGGIFMGGSATLWLYRAGLGASTPWQSIAAAFYGPMAYVGAAGVTAIGALLYFSVAAFYGIVFSGIAAKARSAGKLFFLGILYGTGSGRL